MANLSYATSGPGRLYNSIGWFDFTSVASGVSGPSTFTLANGIKGGGTIQATFKTSIASGNPWVQGQAPPTWNGATYGVTAYLGITGKTCLRDVSGSGAILTTIDVSNIIIRNKYGEAITNYNFYFMDSETPQATSETFITNGSPWEIFYTLPKNPSFADCAMTGIGTTIANTIGTGNMPLLVTRNPTAISQTLTGAGAMSFGLSLTTAELRKVVTGRLNPSDQFELSIIGLPIIFPKKGTKVCST